MVQPNGPAHRSGLSGSRSEGGAQVDEKDLGVSGVLDELVRTCLDLLPVTQVGLLLLDEHGNPELYGPAGEQGMVVDLLRWQRDEGGPCLDCLESGDLVSAGDLTEEAGRWPAFAKRAVSAGFRSAHSVPLRFGGEVIGVLNLFGPEVTPSSTHDWKVAQALADLATIALLQQRAVLRVSRVAERLQTALDTRVVIEQAKGLLAQYARVDADSAFRALRTFARNSNLKLTDVAGSLMDGSLPPGAVWPR